MIVLEEPNDQFKIVEIDVCLIERLIDVNIELSANVRIIDAQYGRCLGKACPSLCLNVKR